jgi:hypothetical protein
MAKKNKKPVFPLMANVVGIPAGYQYPWVNGDTVTILGELSNMPAHYVVVHKGKVYSGYHWDFFVPM